MDNKIEELKTQIERLRDLHNNHDLDSSDFDAVINSIQSLLSKPTEL